MYVSKQTTLVSLVTLATGVSLGYAISNSSATDPVPSNAKNLSQPSAAYDGETASQAAISPSQQPQQQLSEIPIPEVPEIQNSGYKFEWQESLEKQLGHDPLQQPTATKGTTDWSQSFFGKAPKTSFNQTMGLSEDGSTALAAKPSSQPSAATQSPNGSSSQLSQSQNAAAVPSRSYTNSQQVARQSSESRSPETTPSTPSQRSQSQNVAAAPSRSYTNTNSQQVATRGSRPTHANNSQHPQVRPATESTASNNRVAPTAPEMSSSQPQLARSQRGLPKNSQDLNNNPSQVARRGSYPSQQGTAADLMPQQNSRQTVAANPNTNNRNNNTGDRTSNTETAPKRSPVEVPDREKISNVRSQLDSIAAPSEVRQELRGSSPGLTIAVPSGFGADRNTLYTSATYQSETRFSNVEDGAAAIGFGFGNAEEAVGVELSYTMASFGRNRDFGSGGFNLKVHRRLPGDWSVAAGWNGFLNVGDDNDFEDSLYGSASKIFRLKEDIDKPFSRVAVTAGIGNGQFRTEEAVDEDEAGVNAFGSVSVRVARPVSAIVEWTGQDLSLGASVTPFKNIPITITPAVRDVAGAGDEPRFVLGVGMGYQF